MRPRRVPLISALIALPWLLATVGATLRACPDHGDGAHGAAHASHAAPSHAHHSQMAVAGTAAPIDVPSHPDQSHQCNCPGAACCTAVVAVAAPIVVGDAGQTVAVCAVVPSSAPVRWAPSGHDTRLPFANGPPLSA